MQPGARIPAPSVPRAFSGSQVSGSSTSRWAAGGWALRTGVRAQRGGARSGAVERRRPGRGRAGLGQAAGWGPGRRSWESVWETRRQVSAPRPWGSWRPAEGPWRPGSGRGAGGSPGPGHPVHPAPDQLRSPCFLSSRCLRLRSRSFSQVPPPLPGPARAPTSPRGSPGGGGRPCPPPRAAAAPGGAARGRRPWRAQDRAIAATCGTGD